MHSIEWKFPFTVNETELMSIHAYDFLRTFTPFFFVSILISVFGSQRTISLRLFYFELTICENVLFFFFRQRRQFFSFFRFTFLIALNRIWNNLIHSRRTAMFNKYDIIGFRLLDLFVGVWYAFIWIDVQCLFTLCVITAQRDIYAVHLFEF